MLRSMLINLTTKKNLRNSASSSKHPYYPRTLTQPKPFFAKSISKYPLSHATISSLQKNLFRSFKTQSFQFKATPLKDLFQGIHRSHFENLDLLHINEFRQRINANLSGENSVLPKELEKSCEETANWFKNPNNKFYNDSSRSTLTPFLVWAAKNDRIDLFISDGFKKLLAQNLEKSALILNVAIAFNAERFVDAIMDRRLIKHPSIIESGLSVAAACFNQPILESIVNTMEIHNLTLESMGISASFSKKPQPIDVAGDNPLFWAIRCKNLVALRFLLKKQFNPNEYYDEWAKENILFLAVRMGQPEAVELLIEHGIDINQVNFCKNSALHTALYYQKWDIAKLLIKHGLDLYAADDEGLRAIDYIRDYKIKEQFIKLHDDYKAAQMSHLVNIVGLSKAQVLHALYNNAAPAKSSLPGKPDIAEEEYNKSCETGNFYFDYVDLGAGPRLLKLDLGGFEFDARLYDAEHGKGKAAQVIDQLRRAYVEKYQDAEVESFAGMLAKLGSAFLREKQVNLSKNCDEPESSPPKPK